MGESMIITYTEGVRTLSELIEEQEPAKAEKLATRFLNHPISLWINDVMKAIKIANRLSEETEHTINKRRLASALVKQWIGKQHLFDKLETYSLTGMYANLTVTQRLIKNMLFGTKEDKTAVMSQAEFDATKSNFMTICDAEARSHLQALNSDEEWIRRELKLLFQ